MFSPQDDASRKKNLLDYAVHTRHRLARLLVLARWLRSHGSVTIRALQTENIACETIDALEDAADELWNANHTIATAASVRPAVASAVDVLTSGSIPRASLRNTATPTVPVNKHKSVLPAEVSDVTEEPNSPYAVLQGWTSKSDFASITERIGIATRSCIREALLNVGSLTVVKWRSGPAGVCVRVGVDKLWYADVSLDNLDPDNALLRAHAIGLGIRNHVDAPGSTDSNGEAQTTPTQNAVLRRTADDRMSAALNAAKQFANGSAFNATCAMLCALRDMMMEDVCAPLAMDFLRMQAKSLGEGRWKGSLILEGAEPGAPRSQPLKIIYWPAHRHVANVQISEASLVNKKMVTDSVLAQEKDALTLESGLQRNTECLTYAHDPPLPSAVEIGSTHSAMKLDMNNLNLEDLILACVKLRSRGILKRIHEGFVNKHVSLRIQPSCIRLSQSNRANAKNGNEAISQVENVLRIHLGDLGRTGVELRVVAMTGGLRIRPYGAAALQLPVERFKTSLVWVGPKLFKTTAEELDSVIKAFEVIRARVKLNAAARSVCALDIGVSNTLPPGTASVAATASADRAASQLVPPFAPLERRAPRRFLTLSPPPPARGSTHVSSLHGIGGDHSRSRVAGSRGLDRTGSSKRPRLTYATTSDALVFIQESSFAGEDWKACEGSEPPKKKSKLSGASDTDCVDRYNGTAAAAAAWAVTRDVVERRLRRDSLLRAFVAANVASAAQMHHIKGREDGDLHLESASRVLLKVKCEPLPVRRAELLLRGYDAWQVRLSLLPEIFDSTDPLIRSSRDDNRDGSGRQRGDGNLWSVGVACTGLQLTFTYPSANAASVRSFFRDLTRARTAAALARGVPPSPFYRVLRRSPVRIMVGIGPFNKDVQKSGNATTPAPKPLYTATVEYVYSKGNSGGFSLSFSPSKPTMEQLAPLIEEALDASGGQVGGILAGLLERACPLAAAAESAVRERGGGKIRFVTALRVRAVFAGVQKAIHKDLNGQTGPASTHQVTSGQVVHAVDVDARGAGGLVTVIDVGRATVVMIQQGLAPRNSTSPSSNKKIEFVPIPRWDQIVASLTKQGLAEAQRAGSTVLLRMEALEQFLLKLVTSASHGETSRH